MSTIDLLGPSGNDMVKVLITKISDFTVVPRINTKYILKYITFNSHLFAYNYNVYKNRLY